MNVQVVVQRRQLELRGLTTAWLEAGPSATTARTPIILLLHGFPDNADSWSYQIEALKTRATVIAPFVRGAEPSAKGKGLGRYAPDAVGLDVLEILASVDPEAKRPVLCVGHDLGAVHAWRIAELLQKRAVGLVIINGLTIPQMLRRAMNPRQLLKSWYIFLMQVPVLPELAANAAGGRLLNLAYRLGGLSEEFRPDAEQLRGALSGPLNQYRAFVRDIPRALGRIGRRLRCPLLVLWGEEDAFLEPPTATEIERDAEHVTIRILPGNHWLHRQHAERVNGLLCEFIDQCGAIS